MCLLEDALGIRRAHARCVARRYLIRRPAVAITQAIETIRNVHKNLEMELERKWNFIRSHTLLSHRISTSVVVHCICRQSSTRSWWWQEQKQILLNATKDGDDSHWTTLALVLNKILALPRQHSSSNICEQIAYSVDERAAICRVTFENKEFIVLFWRL